MERVFNFSAGPATMPQSVLEQVQKELLDYQGSGMSIMEMSHRSKEYDAVHAGSIERLRGLASIPDNFDILYMSGGASTQFALVPMNLAKTGKVGYINTGSWSKKAIEQAKIQKKEMIEIASSKDSNFNHIPEIKDMPAGLDYVHMTTNNTIFGTQFSALPASGDSKLVIDMSSDVLSRPIDWSNVGLAYAGAQKNAGPAGVTVCVIDKRLYERESEDTPSMMRYSTYADSNSLYNTPPTFQIYMFGLVLEWIEKEGGLAAVHEKNQAKAGLIYDVIDQSNGFYIGHSTTDSRSLMNITFNLKNKDLEGDFLTGAAERKLSGLKGHRSVGGFRASIYNAMPHAGCAALAEYMKEFATQKG